MQRNKQFVELLLKVNALSDNLQKIRSEQLQWESIFTQLEKELLSVQNNCAQATALSETQSPNFTMIQQLKKCLTDMDRQLKKNILDIAVKHRNQIEKLKGQLEANILPKVPNASPPALFESHDIHQQTEQLAQELETTQQHLASIFTKVSSYQYNIEQTRKTLSQLYLSKNIQETTSLADKFIKKFSTLTESLEHCPDYAQQHQSEFTPFKTALSELSLQLKSFNIQEGSSATSTCSSPKMRC